MMAVAVRVLSWLVIASPTDAVDGNVTVAVPIRIHVEPSSACHALIVLPERVNLIQVGATPAMATLLLGPPALLRHCIAMTFTGVKNTDMFEAGASGA